MHTQNKTRQTKNSPWTGRRGPGTAPWPTDVTGECTSWVSVDDTVQDSPRIFSSLKARGVNPNAVGDQCSS